MFSQARLSMQPAIATRDNPISEALSVVRGVKRLFTVPAHIRAQKQGAQLLLKAQGGDFQASADLDRLRFWAATDRAKAVFQGFYEQLEQRFRIPRGPWRDQPPGTPFDLRSVETQLSARATQTKKKKAQDRAGTTNGGRQVSKGGGRQPRGPRPPRQRLVSRYNPSTGRKARVPEDSVEAAEWPSRKPPRGGAPGSRARTERELVRAGGRTAEGLVAAAPAFLVAVKAAGAAAGLGVAATAAAITGAFAVGFAIGTAINKLAAHFSREERNVRKVLAFRAARASFTKAAGRAMTKAEVRQMGAGFKQSLS